MIDLKTRTREYALMIVRLFSELPKTFEAQTLGKQLLRSGTSVGAHYREAVRARSNAEFVSKLAGGLQELEESAYWLELLTALHLSTSKELAAAVRETDELTAIFITCIKSVKQRGKK